MPRFSDVAKKLQDPEKLLKRIIPTQVVRQQRQRAFDQMRNQLMNLIFSTNVFLGGSVAKDTDLNIGSDIDVVIMVRRPANDMPDKVRTNLGEASKCKFDESKHDDYIESCFSSKDGCYGTVSGTWDGVKFDVLIGCAPPEPVSQRLGSFQQAALLCAHANLVMNQCDATKQGIRLAKWWAQQVTVWKPVSYLIELICLRVAIQNIGWKARDVLVAFFQFLVDTSDDQPLRITWHWSDGVSGAAPVVLDPFNRNNNLAEAAQCSDWGMIRTAAGAALKSMRSAGDHKDHSLPWRAPAGWKPPASLESLFLQEIDTLRLSIKALERKANENMVDNEYLKNENLRLRRELARSKQTLVADAALIPPCGLEWQFQVDAKSNKWSGMSADLTIRLEVDHAAFRKDSSKHTATHSSGTESYRFDFAKMSQTNVRTKKVRAIRRRTHTPAHWKTNVDEHPVTNSELKSLAFDIDDPRKIRSFTNLLKGSVVHDLPNEGGDKCNQFKANLQVLRVRQIENWDLWQRYITCKRQIKNELQEQEIQVESIQPPLVGAFRKFSELYGGVDHHVNECYLFHGTSASTAEKIVKEGFDFRLSKPGYYGKGTYFGSQACKSHQYAKSEDGQHVIIVSRVTLGDTWYAQEVTRELPRPPNREDDGRRYDSIIAKPGPMRGHMRKVQAHQEFVLFDKWQAYPEFIIEYWTT